MADDDDPAAESLEHELHRIRHDFHRLHHDLFELLEGVITHNLPLEGLAIMSALDDLKALGVRIDAVTAALPADIATAVQAQKDADAAAVKTAQDALAAAEAAATQAESDLAAEVTDLTAKVTALETAAGIPSTPPAALTVSPTSISSAPGAGITQTLTVSGGTAPYTFASDLADVSVDGSGNVSGTPASPETGTITVSDAAGATAPVSVTIA